MKVRIKLSCPAPAFTRLEDNMDWVIEWLDEVLGDVIQWWD